MRLHMKTGFRLLFVSAVLLAASTIARAQLAPATPDLRTLSNPVWSPDSNRIALTGENFAGVYVYDVRTNELLAVTDAMSSGYAMRWSRDGLRLGFRDFVYLDGVETPLQVPAVYDVAQGRIVELRAPTDRAGVPSFTDDGCVAFTLGEDLVVLDQSGQEIARRSLG
jgi:hypothetical protein